MSAVATVPYTVKNTPDNFSGGNIYSSALAWAELTSDIWVKQTVCGNLPDLEGLHVTGNTPYVLPLPSTDQTALDLALQEYLKHEIIELCPDTADSFYSTVFPRFKRDGSVRVIFNMKTFNELYIERIHFKMDTIRDALLLVTPQCFFASIDLKHAYFSVPIARHFRHMFRFRWGGHTHQFTCLPQGFAPAPRIFTKLLKPALAHLRSLGIQVICYIDDCLFISDCPVTLKEQVLYALKLFDRLGLTVHPSKSVIEPAQCIEFLGFDLDSRSMLSCLTRRKQDKIHSLATSLSTQATVTIRDLAGIIGNLVAADPGVTLGPLHYKALEIERNDHLSRNHGNYEAVIQLSPEARNSLQWWASNIHSLSRPIQVAEPAFEIFTDASLIGWGARMGDQNTGGQWAESELVHINQLELKAAFLAVKALCKTLHDTHVKIRSDNSTTVACINKAGSTKRALLAITYEFLNWALERNIVISAAHIPGVANIDADRESRMTNSDTEWMLLPNIFSEICQALNFQPHIDMFATRLNHQCPVYVAWRPDPDAYDIDAFSMNWQNLTMYCFPPFSVIGRMLQKLNTAQATALVILPMWPTKPWFVRALRMLVRPPKLLPKKSLVLPQHPSLQHPLFPKLTLAAMTLSGNVTETAAFRKTLQPSLCNHGGPAPMPNMGAISKNGCSFVTGNKVVHFTHL